MVNSDEYPIRASQHVIEPSSTKLFRSKLPDEWVVRELSERDDEVDALVEISEQGRMTGRVFASQLKGESQFTLRGRPSASRRAERTSLGGLLVTGLSVAFLISAQGAAFAQDQGTPEQQEACKPDVFHLCSNFIPDADRITACLRGNEPQLSQSCHDVFFPPQAEKPKKTEPKKKSKARSDRKVFDPRL